MGDAKPLSELIDELQRLFREVEPGEWSTAPEFEHSAQPRSLGISNGAREVLRHGAMRYSDAAFVVAVHNAFPLLLNALRQLERERDELLERLRLLESAPSGPAPHPGSSPERADEGR